MSKDCSVFGQFLVIITFLVHLAITQPIGDGSSPVVRSDPGGDSRKSIDSMNPNKISSMRKDSNEQAQGLFLDSLRPRRSPKYPPPAELQTIMSGNWHDMDAQALFKLLNSLATSKETLPDDYFGYDNPDDEDPIDLVYSGRSKPFLLGATLSSAPNHLPGGAKASLRGVQPLGEPISIMSSNMHHLRNENDDEATPLQRQRGIKAKKLSRIILKRSMSKDFVQLPNGEIAFTPHAIHVIRYHQPFPVTLMNDGLTFSRRPVL